jgi:hypothetical protein
MPLTEQLIVRASGPITREALDRLRSRLGLQRSGRLGDAEDVHFGVRYLRRTETELTDLTLVREDDTAWRVELNYLQEPLPAAAVAALRADVLAALAEVGLTVTDVWEPPGRSGPAGA